MIELVLPPDLREKAYVYISLVYPEGLRQVSETVINPERAPSKKVVLDLESLREAWERERGKTGLFAEPFIIVTGFTRSGRVFVHGVEVFWEELPKSIKLTLTPLMGVNVIDKQEKSVGSEPVGVELKLLNGCWTVRYKVDEYDWITPAVIMKVTPDSITWGTIAYGYHINHQVGFRISVFIESQWTSAGFFTVSKNSGGSHGAYFLPGQEYYIWMNFKYRYEKWRVYGRCDPEIIDYYEEYVFIADFYPETINGGPTPPPSTQLPPTDTWIYEGRYNATSPYLAYYRRSHSDFGSAFFAIDAMKFISVLSQLGKISSKATTVASTIGLTISVNFVYNKLHSFHFYVWLHSNPGTVHKVYSTCTVDYQSVPVLYFSSYYVG